MIGFVIPGKKAMDDFFTNKAEPVIMLTTGQVFIKHIRLNQKL